MNHYTAVMKQKGDWWIGWIAEVPEVNCQERSKEEHLRAHGCVLVREGARHSERPYVGDAAVMGA